MSIREAHESRPQQAEKAHESGDKQSHPLAHVAADALTNPSSKLSSGSQAHETGIQKDFGNNKSFDFSSAQCPYGDKGTAKQQGSTADSRPSGEAHSMTDGKGETKPAFSSHRPDFSNKPEQGETKPGTLPQKPDFSNKPENNYADGKKQNNDAQIDHSKELGRREYDEKPAAEKPAAEKPATNKPAADKPVADKPASDLEPVVQPIPDPADAPSDSKPAESRPEDSKPASSNKPLGDQSWSSELSQAFFNAVGYRL